MEEIDLIDDIWLQVFNYFGVDRARLAIVCKRWADVILHPLNWRTFEADFQLRKRTFAFKNSKEKNYNIEPFIAKYCTNLVDCYLTIESRSRNVNSLLNVLFQIKTLRRLVLRVSFVEPVKVIDVTVLKTTPNQASPVREDPLLVPQCKDMVLLNLSVHQLETEGLQTLLSGLPNLEDLYLDLKATLNSVELFAPVQKLKLLTLSNGALSNLAELRRLSELLPNLRYVVYEGTKNFWAPNSQDALEPLTVGNLTIVPTAVLEKGDLASLKRLGKFVSPANQPLLLLRALNYRHNKEVIRYLITECHFDVNFVFRGLEEKYPLHAALASKAFMMGRSVAVTDYLDVVEELLKLGADPNSPLASSSPLVHCGDAASFLLLLKYGANPNKIVNGYPAAWSIFLLSSGTEEALKGLIGVCDVNAVHGAESATMLLRAIFNRSRDRQAVVDLLLEAGAQWTPLALNSLRQSMPQLFEDVVRNRKADLSMLETTVIFESIEQGSLELFRDHLKTLTADEKQPKLSPMHYAALIMTNGAEIGQDLQPNRKGTSDIFRWRLTTLLSGDTQVPRRIGKKLDNNNKQGSTQRSSSNALSFPSSMFGATTTTPMFNFGSTATNSGALFGGAMNNFSAGNKGSTSKLESIDEVIPLLNCSINEKTSDGATPLLLLCMSLSHSSEAKVKNATSLIKHGANVNLADKYGWTPLHAALYTGDWSLASLLLEHGADINAQDMKGITPLMALIYGFRHIEQLGFDNFESEWSKLITSFNVDLSLVDRSFNRSLVHLMAAVGSPAMFECAEQTFLKAELINARDIEGFTPLHYAVMFDNIETVQYLLDHGANANAQTISLKITPAMMLCNMVEPTTTSNNSYLTRYNTLLMAKFLRSSIGQIGSFNKSFISPPWNRPNIFFGDHITEERILNFNTMLKVLVMPSNPAIIDDDGNTIVHHLVDLLQPYSELVPRCSVIFDLLQTVKSFKPHWNAKNFKNETPANKLIHYVCSADSLSLLPYCERAIELIREQSIDIAHEGVLDAFEQLLCHKVIPAELKLKFMSLIDLSRFDNVRHTRTVIKKSNPLFAALQGQHSGALIKAIIEAYPSIINDTNEDGATPLVAYVKQGVQFTAALDALFEASGVDLNAQDQDGNTALHYACKYFHIGFIDAVDAIECLRSSLFAFKLVEAGARTDLKNKRGQTPLDYSPKLLEHYEKVYPIVKQFGIK